MEIIITARHFDLDPDLEAYVENELNYLEDKYKRLDNAHAVLIKEKYRKIAEVTLHADGNNYYSKEESDDMYISIDRVIEKLETQIKKFREKRRDESRQHREEEEMTAAERMERDRYLEEEMGEPAIVPVEMSIVKPMNEDEAAMQLKMSNNIFLPFMNARTGDMNVIYKRTDGDFGLIQPPK